MQVEAFVARNRERWERLSRLVERAQGNGIRRLAPDDLEALGEGYRAATSDLALARRDYPDHPVAAYLNQLVARAHATVYRGRPTPAMSVAGFLGATVPRAFRALWPFILAACLLVVAPAIVNGVLTYRDPGALEWTLGDEAREIVPLLERGQLWIDDALPPEERPAASAFIMTNNIRVSLAAFAGGASAGLFTLYILLVNGLQLGGLLGLTFAYGLGWRLVNFVAGHGVIELSVVFMAGGAGLRMGWAILHPGALPRRDALILATRQALALAAGAVPLLVVAGAIEAFISPLFNPLFSAAAAVVSGALMYGWLLLGGRREPGRR
jgi:uncharacterized membrane protein SpoIIM required for sporulation